MPTAAAFGDDVVSADPVTATGQIHKNRGAFFGFVVVASTSGNIAFFDNTAASGTALWSGAVTAGQVVAFPKGMRLTNGLYFQLVSGSATVRPLYR